ncbi:unnamed protein product [Brugia timori]|uniref:PDZ domain-containing protein n=1 Tax=Brugia timori TaxID=42155 RepID=A0A0R3QW01_9BILA|nr:unnamed protein product [Brugia timori]
MAYETITVRMNRSNNTIPWGFSVIGGDPAPIRISTVQKESLADKAGLQIGDTITEFSGRTTKGMSLQEARNIIEKVSLEISMLLQRFVFFPINLLFSKSVNFVPNSMAKVNKHLAISTDLLFISHPSLQNFLEFSLVTKIGSITCIST